MNLMSSQKKCFAEEKKAQPIAGMLGLTIIDIVHSLLLYEDANPESEYYCFCSSTDDSTSKQST